MRRINLTGTLGVIKDPAVKTALQEIERASVENDLLTIANDFIITGVFAELRTLNVGTSTLAQTQAFIATLVNDFKKGGSKRST